MDSPSVPRGFRYYSKGQIAMQIRNPDTEIRRPGLWLSRGQRALAAVALLAAGVLPAVGLEAQSASACPLVGECNRPGTPNEVQAQVLDNGTSVRLDWTNTASEAVSFEIHRRENGVDVAKDVTGIIGPTVLSDPQCSGRVTICLGSTTV